MVGRIVLCLAVLAWFGVQAAYSVERFQAPPHKCCLPKQYSAHITMLNTINSDTFILLDTQMDYNRKRQASLNYTISSGSKTLNMRFVIDYTNGSLYVIPNIQPEMCFKVPISPPLVECIPDDAEYLGSDFLGPMGAGQLPYDAWRMKYPSATPSVTYTIAVAKESCVPLAEGAAYPDDPGRNELFFFSGFQPNLTDPSMFDLPASCFK